MTKDYKTIHTRISPQSSTILEKFTRKESALFLYKGEVIEVALLLLDSVFESETFDTQITRTNAKELFRLMSTDAKRAVFREFIKHCRYVDEVFEL